MSAELLRRAFDSTGAVLANVSADQMSYPTPCASWKVSDLVDHIVGGTTYFAITAETGVAPTEPAAPTDGSADHASGDFKAVFRTGADRAVAAFAADGALDSIMKLPFAELPGSVFVLIAATDSFTHGWDLARATGQSADLDPELAKRLHEAVAGFLPDSMRGPDGQKPFGPRVEVPTTASAADQLAAFMGRQP